MTTIRQVKSYRVSTLFACLCSLLIRMKQLFITNGYWILFTMYISR